MCLTSSVLAQPDRVTLRIIDGTPDRQLSERIESNTSKFLTEINRAYINNNNQVELNDINVSAELNINLQKLWSDVRFYCKDNNISVNLLTRANSYQIRNVEIALDTNYQSVVICYDREGTIIDFYFGLDIHQYTNVMDVDNVVDRTRREIILNFVESFRTAYIRRDINFIEDVFSDHALIIVGRVIETQDVCTENMRSSIPKKQVEYLTLSKTEYINRLKHIFNNISYLILEFKDIEVSTHRKHSCFYGVMLNQHYESSIYSDEGFLFLLIQFREENHPLIWVRTWQSPEHAAKYDYFGFHNFRITGGSIR